MAEQNFNESGLGDSFFGLLASGKKKQQKQEEAMEDQILPRNERVPIGRKQATPKIKGELTGKRNANAKFYELSDGRIQAEIASGPVHYKDSKGKWQDIDPSITATETEPGFSLGNKKNTFHTFFGKKPEQLVKFKLGNHHLTLGVEGAKEKTIAPKVDKNKDSLVYPEVFSKTDLRYTVTPTSLKEEIILHEAPKDATYKFSLRLGGVIAKERKDGSNAFTSKQGDRVLFIIPKLFMMDDKEDPASPYGKVWSDKVTQSVEQKGANITITVKADEKWLQDSKRKYPVTIDPTIIVQPTPSQSKDTYIMSGSETNYDGMPWVSVGTTNTQKARGLVRFSLTGIPKDTVLDAASLEMYYDQIHTTNAHDVEMEVHGLTQDWTASEVNWTNAKAGVPWKTAGGSMDSEVAHNREIVDNTDAGKTSFVGSWPYSTSVSGYYGTNYQPNVKGTGADTFTWVPHLTEDGKYDVDVYYTAAFDRATNAPYTVHHKEGSEKKTVNQQTGSSKWKNIGSWHFHAGSSHKVVLSDDADGYVIADAIRLTKYARVTKKARTNNQWHKYSIRSLAQKWINEPEQNFGALIKATDEGTLGQGGPRYLSSEHQIRPKLVLVYGDPSVTLEEPTKVYGTGAELSWGKYKGNDFGEYQVHRSIYQNFTPSNATLVAPLNDINQVSYTDTTAKPTPADSPQPTGEAYYYRIVVKTKHGKLLPSNTVLTRLPKAGMIKEIFPAKADTTLASGKPDTNMDKIGTDPWLQVGNSSSNGTTRPVLYFDLSSIPRSANISRADLDLWEWQVDGNPGAIDVHALTKPFGETTATWNKADSNTSWIKAGGDYLTPAGGTNTNITNDLRWHTWRVAGIVQDCSQANHGFLLKQQTEGSGGHGLFLSSEFGDSDSPDGEQALRPRLVVYYTNTPADGTYYAPDTPSRMIPGDRYTVDVTLTNTTRSTWKAGEIDLSYHWALPDGTDVTTGGNRLETALKDDLAPGETVTVTAELRTPIQSEKGNKREAFVLQWDLLNKTSGKWLRKETIRSPPWTKM